MCGSILEAILVAMLRECEEKAQTAFRREFSKSKNLDRWTLYELIIVAGKLDFLDEDTQRHADIIRDYRNVIHPSREVRSQIKIDDNLVAAEVALLKRILSILSTNQTISIK